MREGLLGCISFPSASILVSALDNLAIGRYVLIITLYPFWFFFFYHLGFCKFSIPALKKNADRPSGGIRVQRAGCASWRCPWIWQRCALHNVLCRGCIHRASIWTVAVFGESSLWKLDKSSKYPITSKSWAIYCSSRQGSTQKYMGIWESPAKKKLNTNHGETRSTRTR